MKIYGSLEILRIGLLMYKVCLHLPMNSTTKTAIDRLQNLIITEDQTSVKEMGWSYYSEKTERQDLLTQINTCRGADIFQSALLKHFQSVNDLLNDLLLDFFQWLIPCSTEIKQNEDKELSKSLLPLK